MPSATDALGRTITLERPPQRIISLVPSITEAVAALGKGRQLAAVTKFCLEPAEVVRGLRKIGGTKNPDVDAIVALQPDLVLANQEENRREDVEALIDAGLPVFVGYPRSVAGAMEELEELSTLLGMTPSVVRFLRDAQRAIERSETLNAERPRVRAFCPVWRSPYLAVGGDTYAGDVLRLAGADNVFDRHWSGARYPQVTLQEIIAADPEIILLPDEPYRFRERHREELMAMRALSAVRNECIFLADGRWLTWYGPRMADGLREIERLLDRARPDWTAPAEDTDERVKSGRTSVAQVTPTRPAGRAAKPKRASGAALPPGLSFRVDSQDVVDEKG